jgi:hypothetical protein
MAAFRYLGVRMRQNVPMGLHRFSHS